MAYSVKFREKLFSKALGPDANVSDIARRARIPKGTFVQLGGQGEAWLHVESKQEEARTSPEVEPAVA